MLDRRSFGRRLGLGAAAWGTWASTGLGAPPPEVADVPLPDPARGPDLPVTVDDFRRLARRKLPRATYDYITSGSTDEDTLRENVAAFRRIQVMPPILSGVAAVDTTTDLFGTPISFPLLLAPVAAQRLYHPQGASAAARAAAAAGTIFGVSTSVGNSVEEIAAASSGPKWFQLYVPKDRQVARQLIERVEQAGYRAIIVTVDLGELKDPDRRQRFALPKEMLLKHLRDVGIPHDPESSHEALIELNRQAWDLSFSWDFFDWLRSITKLPLLVKGVLRPADAEKAVSIGLDGLVVSNHGGRRLDGMPASITCLPEVVAAVRGRATVLLDSGVRRGVDILKALALGARGVLVGRPYAWALAAQGEAGVSQIIELFREEFTVAMHSCGCASLADIRPDLLRKV